MKVFLVPGLGYDHRIFQRLNLDFHDVVILNWIEPRKNESLADYAQRMFDGLLPEHDKVVLIGHSFGGMICQALASRQKVEEVVLISSVRSRSEIPLIFKLVSPLGLHHIFTKELCIKTLKYWGGAHGFETEAEKNLFKGMVGAQSNTFLQWALNMLSQWKAPKLIPNTGLFQIHGTDDRTFPFDKILTPSFVVQGGSHIMVYKEPESIKSALLQRIETISLDVKGN